jgi:hypothetical protein
MMIALSKVIGLRIMSYVKRLASLLTAAACLTLTSCGAMQVAGNTSDVNNALAAGKGVLVTKAQTFNPQSSLVEWIELPGAYRPPLTYWIHRQSGKPLILGARDSEEGKGKVFTREHFYYVLEPGLYDFAGFVEKTHMGNLANLPVTTSGIKSNIGFVNFSSTPLPTFYTYDAWVPPGYTGTTFDGNTLTHWYGPGYWESRGAWNPTDGIFVDMRGLIPNNANGEANFATLIVEPGKIGVISDFKIEYTHDACDKPTEGQWVCPISSFTLSAAFTPQEETVKSAMSSLPYSRDLISKVSTSYLLPGAFFSKSKMQPSEQYGTEDGKPYGKFRVTRLTLPNVPMQKK